MDTHPLTHIRWKATPSSDVCNLSNKALVNPTSQTFKVLCISGSAPLSLERLLLTGQYCHGHSYMKSLFLGLPEEMICVVASKLGNLNNVLHCHWSSLPARKRHNLSAQRLLLVLITCETAQGVTFG